MNVPRLTLRVADARAYCGRPGCDRLIGTVEHPRLGTIRLEHTAREGWVWLNHPDPFATLQRTTGPLLGGPSVPAEFGLRRRRSRNPAVGGPSTSIAAEAAPGDVIECPRCHARQVVPARTLTPEEDAPTI